MSARSALRAVMVLAVLAAASCGFAPDLTRFSACEEGDRCGAGLTCILPERRCVPDCLDCEAPVEDAGDDAGEDDAGTDAGETSEDGGGGEDGGSGDGGSGDDAGPGEDAGVTALWVAPTLLRGVEGAPYSQLVEVDGGTAPYAFAPLSASVPTGMTWDSDGTLRGTPGTVGVFVLRAEVQDSSQPPQRADASVTWEVHPVLRFAGPVLLAEAPANSAYDERVSAHGGVPPYSFAVVAGSFTGSVQLSADGAISGNAAGQTSQTVTLRVTDSATPPQEVTTVADYLVGSNGLGGLRILTRALPSGRTDFPYAYSLRSYGGANVHRWARTDGVLPLGLSLDESGLLSGTPQQKGSFLIEVSVTDNALVPATKSASFELEIY